MSRLVRRLAALLFAAFVFVPAAQAQEEGLLQLDGALERFLLRQQAAGHLPEARLSHRPISAYDAHRYLDSLQARRSELGALSQKQLDEFRGERYGTIAEAVRERLPFYQNGRAFYSVSGESLGLDENFGVEVDPLFYFAYGRARQTALDNQESNVPFWQNTRGIRIAGHVTDYIFFDTQVEENQRRIPLPDFRQAGETAPRLAAATRLDGGGGYDWLRATGVVGFKSRHFEARFGRDRNTWGPGRTSLVVSDYAPAYTQLQLRTTFWRVQYVNLFTEMTDLTPLPDRFGDQALPHKYGAFHRLAVELPGRVELGLFESVIFAPDTSGGERTRNDLALSYLNPLIFYRAVERDEGSPDNVLLGLDAAWTAFPGLRLYGTFMLDELVVSDIGNQSWRNKWGFYAGAHLADLPLDGASLRLEYARMRPYFYAHRTGTTSYTHFNDLLGHPAGPNAEDFALFADWQITPRIQGAVNLAYTRRGRGTDSLNVGADPLETTSTRACALEEGANCLTDVPFRQGIEQNALLVEARLGYELLPQVYLEAALRAESTDDAQAGTNRYAAPYLLLRWGLPYQSVRY